MKHPLCSLLLISLFPVLSSHAQNWEKIGNIDGPPRTMYTDTVDQVLYLAGGYFTFNGDTMWHIGKWNGTTLLPMGSFNSHLINSIVRYGNDIYAAGSFDFADSVYCRGLARWDGSKWNAV